MTVTATVTFDDWVMAALYAAGLLGFLGVAGVTIQLWCVLRAGAIADRRLEEKGDSRC